MSFILQKLKNLLDRQNHIRLSGSSSIDKSVQLKEVKIFGNVTIAENCRIVGGVRIQSNSHLTMGRYTSVNGPNTDFFCAIHPISIGSFCAIARNVVFQEFNHIFDRPSSYYMMKNIFNEKVKSDMASKGSIEIGHDVWIGTHAVILTGAKIGHGAVIGANTVVSGVVPPYAIVTGSPAKVVRYRFEEPIIQKLLELKWWDWPMEKIKQNKAFFENKLTPESFSNIK